MSNGTGMKDEVSGVRRQNKKESLKKDQERVRGVIYHSGSATKSTGDVIWLNAMPSRWVRGDGVEMGEGV